MVPGLLFFSAWDPTVSSSWSCDPVVLVLVRTWTCNVLELLERVPRRVSCSRKADIQEDRMVREASGLLLIVYDTWKCLKYGEKRIEPPEWEEYQHIQEGH